MRKDCINYGIIGFGSYAERRLIPAFSKARHARLIAISRREIETAHISSLKYEIPYYYSSPIDLVKNSEVDAVIVATPPAMHMEHAILAAKHKKHILLEKPMTSSAVEMKKIINYCKRYRVKLMSAFVMRFIDAIQTAKELIQGELLGKLSYAGGYMGINASLIKREWLEDPLISAGGAVADLGSHILDLLEYITGKKIVNLKLFLKPQYSRQTIEKNAIIGLEFEGDIIGSAYLSFSISRESGLTFWGSKGKLSLQNFNRPEEEVELELISDRGIEKIHVLNRSYYALMLDHFAHAILYDEPLVSPGTDGLHNQQLLDRVYQRK